ncbi:MAG: hypothetical protein ACAH88_11530 [Roseimicrobium sp.]
MSRSTKYIIAAVFLVLLSIPVVYVVLTWHPRSPLTFRLVGQEMKTDRDGFPLRVLDIEITNSSEVPISLHAAMVHDGPHISLERGYLGEVRPEFDVDRRVMVPFTVPARGSIRRPAALHAEIEQVPVGEIHIAYIWNSRTRQSAVKCWFWLDDRMPVLSKLSQFPYSPCRDTTPLIVSPKVIDHRP